jgi:energy-coupling factor transporter ATP-binding protein EcfA2
MRHLIIRNIGPVKEAEIELKRFNFIIGPQSSGKSTVAKILSTCCWIEKEVATTMNEDVIADAASFVSLMEDFHKMIDYFDDDSEIEYDTDVISISLKGKEFQIRLKNQDLYRRDKICYIPSERNAVTLPELQGFEFGQTNLRSFLFDWYNAREFYCEDNKSDILNLGVRYYYDPSEQKYKDRIEHVNGKTYKIPLGSASSGLQSVVPLQIMMQYYTNQYFNTFAEKTSFDSDIKTRMIQDRVIDKYVLSVAYPGFDPKNRNELIKEQNVRIHEGNPEARALLEKYRQELDFVLEEIPPHLAKEHYQLTSEASLGSSLISVDLTVPFLTLITLSAMSANELLCVTMTTVCFCSLLTR